MDEHSIPLHEGEPIIDSKPRQAFRVDTEEIIFSIKQQYSDRTYLFRELGQNSADASASKIDVTYRYEDGVMISEFRDNGCGMTEEVIDKYYLMLFSSSKEDNPKAVGYFSLGRLSAFCYDNIVKLEILTMADGHPGYRLEINSDFSLRKFEVDPDSMEEVLGHHHGTLVRLSVRFDTIEEFHEEVKKINATIKSELAWIEADLRIQEFKEVAQDGNEESFETNVVNKKMEVPGEYTMNKKCRLKSGEELSLSLGLSTSESSDISSITMCKGKIPIVRPGSLPWLDDCEPFSIDGIKIIMDSYDFKVNIGRNHIYHTEFYETVIPKIFDKLILNEYVLKLARIYKYKVTSAVKHKAYFNLMHSDTDKAILNLIVDILYQSSKHGFTVPDELYRVPFIPGYNSIDYYSIEDLNNETGKIYYSSKNRNSAMYARDYDEEKPEIVCIALSEMPWRLKDYLKSRFALEELAEPFVVRDEGKGRQEIATDQVNNLLMKRKRQTYLFARFSGSPAHCNTTVGDFRSLDGKKEDKKTRSAYLKNPNRVCINYNSDYVKDLINLSSIEKGIYAKLAGHLLLREILFTKGLDYNVLQRENLLTSDITTRFGSKFNEDNLKDDTNIALNEMIALLEELNFDIDIDLD